MNLKTLVAMLGRKNANTLGGVMLGLFLAVQYRDLVAQLRDWIAAVGMGGLLSVAVSYWLSMQRDQAHADAVQDALYAAPPGHVMVPTATVAATLRPIPWAPGQAPIPYADNEAGGAGALPARTVDPAAAVTQGEVRT